MPQSAEQLIANLDRKKEGVMKMVGKARKSRVFCVEWLKPLMNAGHWIPEMIELAGGVDELAKTGHPSTYVDGKNVVDYDPEIIVLMPCGFTIERTVSEAKHLFGLQGITRISAAQNKKVFATDGHGYFSRSGPRLFDGIRILAKLFHPELFGEPLDPDCVRRVELVRAEA